MCLAIPGKILEVEGDDLFRKGRVDFSGIIKEVNLSFVPEAKVGDYVIVHVGMAISRLDEEAALEVFSYLKEMGELADLQDSQLQNGSQKVSSWRNGSQKTVTP